ncbi:threonine dehydratase [Apiospora phragmitis]|uniref:Threonine dehydratase n=1 Tax=Apiospora phragmitis TaxID=2905665 RepID=A0ABR1TUA3_9PEZI
MIVTQPPNSNKVRYFKYRGALNALWQLDDEVLSREIVTYNTGNHARALLEAARDVSQIRNIEVPMHIVVPEKLKTIETLRPHLYLEPGYNLDACSHRAHQIAPEKGAKLVASPDDAVVLEGHGTIGLEWPLGCPPCPLWRWRLAGLLPIGAAGCRCTCIRVRAPLPEGLQVLKTEVSEHQIRQVLELPQGLGMDRSIEPSSAVPLAGLLLTEKFHRCVYI